MAVAYGLTRGSWLNGLLVGVTLAMALLPEELPIVLAVFFAMGAWRMSRKGVLTRRLPAIETLGSATVLCADKTGTLTENRMAVRALVAGDRELRVGPGLPEELPEELHALVEHAILASQRDPFDPMEVAIRRLGRDEYRVIGKLEMLPQAPLVLMPGIGKLDGVGAGAYAQDRDRQCP